jgi:hypothetical protein
MSNLHKFCLVIAVANDILIIGFPAERGRHLPLAASFQSEPPSSPSWFAPCQPIAQMNGPRNHVSFEIRQPRHFKARPQQPP